LASIAGGGRVEQTAHCPTKRVKESDKTTDMNVRVEAFAAFKGYDSSLE